MVEQTIKSKFDYIFYPHLQPKQNHERLKELFCHLHLIVSYFTFKTEIVMLCIIHIVKCWDSISDTEFKFSVFNLNKTAINFNTLILHFCTDIMFFHSYPYQLS